MKKTKQSHNKSALSVRSFCPILIAGGLSLLSPATSAWAAANVKAQTKNAGSASATVDNLSTSGSTQPKGNKASGAQQGGAVSGTVNTWTPKGSTGTSSMPAIEFSGLNDTALEAAGQIENAWFPSSPLKITINRGLDALSEEVIPKLANPDEFDFADALFVNNQHISCFVADVGVKDMHLSAPVNKNTVSGTFGNNGKVFTTIDLDASFEATFFWDLEADDGVLCDVVKAIDNAADAIIGLFGGNGAGSETSDDISYEELTLTAEGLEAEFDFTLALSGGQLSVSSIDKLSAEIGSLDYDGTALVEGLAVLAEDVVNLVAGDVTDVVNDVINQEVLPDQEERLQEFINTALEQNLTVAQSVDLGDYAAAIEVAPSALKSSKSENTMTMEFSFDIASDAPAATCAEDLSFGTTSLNEPESTTADFDIQIPHWAIAKTIYEAGRQGLFCQNTLMPLSNDPWTLRPAGTLTVANARFTETITPANGFPYSVTHHFGELALTVPMVFEGDGQLYFGAATADLTIYVKPVIPSGDRKVYLTVTEIEFVNVVGSMTLLKGTVVDMSNVVNDALNAAADVLETKIGNIPLLPKTTTFSEDLAIEISVIEINDSYTTIGVDIVNAPAPADDDQGGWGWTFERENDVRPLDEDEVPQFDSLILDRIDPVP